MTIDDLDELQYITGIANTCSICEHGILSHARAESVEHESVAMEEIQERRANKLVPLGSGGRRSLHSYANLYICARNPMMTWLRAEHDRICVIRVHKAVLTLEGVVIADRNAARSYARFQPAPAGLAMIDRDRVFAEYWTHEDPHEYDEHKGIKCAEVLVPDRVPPQYIIGAWVGSETALATLRRELDAATPRLPVDVNGYLFSC